MGNDNDENYDEVTSGLSDERYTMVNRSVKGNINEQFNDITDCLEGSSNQLLNPNNGSYNIKNDEIDPKDDYESDEGGNENDIENNTEDELVLERLRSSSPIGTTNREKPSLIPNESRFNAVEYLINSLNNALDSLAFDKALVVQSKMAGELNNSSNEVLITIKNMEDSLKEHISKYNELRNEILPEIELNLQKGTRLANKLTEYVKTNYPVEYSKGRSKILDNLTEEEEGLYS